MANPKIKFDPGLKRTRRIPQCARSETCACIMNQEFSFFFSLLFSVLYPVKRSETWTFFECSHPGPKQKKKKNSPKNKPPKTFFWSNNCLLYRLLPPETCALCICIPADFKPNIADEIRLLAPVFSHSGFDESFFFFTLARDFKHSVLWLFCFLCSKLKMMGSDTSEWGTSKQLCMLNSQHTMIHVSVSVLCEGSVVPTALFLSVMFFFCNSFLVWPF